MQIALTESQQAFVEQAVSEGRYSSEAEVVSRGLEMVELYDRKLAELRAIVQESLKDTSIVSEEELDAALEQAEQELIALGYPE